MKQKSKFLCLGVFVVLSILANLNSSMKIVALLYLGVAVLFLNLQDGFLMSLFSLAFVNMIKHTWITSCVYFVMMFILMIKACVLYKDKKPISKRFKLFFSFSCLWFVCEPLVAGLIYKSFSVSEYFVSFAILCLAVLLFYIYDKINAKKVLISLVAGVLTSMVIVMIVHLTQIISFDSLWDALSELYFVSFFDKTIWEVFKTQFSTIHYLLFGNPSVSTDNIFVSFVCKYGLAGVVICLGFIASVILKMLKEGADKNFWATIVALLLSVFVGRVTAIILLALGIVLTGQNYTRDIVENKDEMINGYYFLAKRVVDVVVSLIGLVVASIPMLVVAVLVKVTSKGPVFFKDKRIGKGGKTITVLKFRSMYKDAEARLEQYLTKEQLELWKKERKVDNDPRITKVGKFIRKTSLDELPQLFNILKGDLSIVGNRPLSKLEYDIYFNDAEKELLDSMQPGLTGYWQAYGRSNVTFLSGERQKMYIYYPKNASIKLDIKIFFKTIAVVLKRDGAK